MEFPPEILTRAKELIPILSAKLKVTHKYFSCHVKNEELNKKKKKMDDDYFTLFAGCKNVI